MESAAAISTIFGILVPYPSFEFSFPMAVILLAVCVGAWVLMVVDMRRKRPDNIPTQEEIDREFDRFVHRR